MGNEFWSWIWETYKANREHIVPLLTFVAASIVAWAALRQARTATRQAKTAAQQAEIARLRHEEQTKADHQRRITESFTKAVEQLGSEKPQIRLGGIYTLERLARESERDYWPIMETLTAFVRDQAPWKGENSQQPPPRLPTDIAAVLTTIARLNRDRPNREPKGAARLDLTSTDLRRADLSEADLREARLIGAHLEGADLQQANLKGAWLLMAHLEDAMLTEADLERTNFGRADLKGAWLTGSHLKLANFQQADLKGVLLRRVDLTGANLSKADLKGADLAGANLEDAHLDGVDLEGAHLQRTNLEKTRGPTQDQLNQSYGNAETKLPEGLVRPAHWSQ